MVVDPVTGKTMPKAEFKKLQKERAKAEKKAKAAANVAANQQAAYVAPQLTLEDMDKDDVKLGDLPIHMSQQQFQNHKNFVQLTSLDQCTNEIENLRTHAFLYNVRAKSSSIAFLILRQKSTTLQAVVADKDLVKYCKQLPKESFLAVYGNLKKSDVEIQACSVKNFELHVTKVFAIDKALPLPMQVEDAARAGATFDEGVVEGEGSQEENKQETAEKKDKSQINISREVRLDNRILDLRTPANQAIFRIRSQIIQSFSQYLISQNFIQISTPKLIAGSSEGGADVFKTTYFKTPACLSQSPQLHKQMSIASGFQRVFEVGPVFRAEQSHTHRHLCEFTGLDLEMEIVNSYDEVIELLHGLMCHIYTDVYNKCEKELTIVREQYASKMPGKLVWTEKPVVVDFLEGVKMLNDAGYKQGELDDLCTENERALGKLVKEKYNTDFYILNHFPTQVRAFYTMPYYKDERYSNSFDMFIRGEEICSGAQRIHDPVLLTQKIQEKGIPVESLQTYIDSFKYGCPPHGGAGLGLERVVMLILGIEDVRQTCLFPRTPGRIIP